MMFKKKAFASAVASTLVAGAALVSGGAQAVTISKTDVGQILLGEMYLARPGESTRITVINTDLDNAVKARLALRSKKHSDECFDVILYLTPGDVAYVDIENAGEKIAKVKSTDDSLLSLRKSDGTIKFASQEGFAFDYNTKPPRTEPAADTCTVGHVEVIATYAASDTVNVASGAPAVNVRRGMSKFELIRIFDTPKPQLNALNANTCRVTNDGSVGCDGANFNNRVRLMGNAEIKFAGGRILNNMVALESGANEHTGGVITHAVTNPGYDTTVGQELLIGRDAGQPGEAGIVNMFDKMWDIEGALKTTRLFNAYTKAGTSFEVTFPTKYRHIVTGRYSGSGATYSPPFFSNGAVQYTADLFDMQERSAPAQVTDVCVVSPCDVPTVTANFLIHEVNYEVLSGTATWDPPLGWFNFTLTNRPGVDNSSIGTGMNWVATDGVPAIGYGHYYQANLNNSVASRLGR